MDERFEQLQPLAESILDRHLSWTLFSRAAWAMPALARFFDNRFDLLLRIQKTWGRSEAGSSFAALPWMGFGQGRRGMRPAGPKAASNVATPLVVTALPDDSGQTPDVRTPEGGRMLANAIASSGPTQDSSLVHAMASPGPNPAAILPETPAIAIEASALPAATGSAFGVQPEPPRANEPVSRSFPLSVARAGNSPGLRKRIGHAPVASAPDLRISRAAAELQIPSSPPSPVEPAPAAGPAPEPLVGFEPEISNLSLAVVTTYAGDPNGAVREISFVPEPVRSRLIARRLPVIAELEVREVSTPLQTGSANTSTEMRRSTHSTDVADLPPLFAAEDRPAQQAFVTTVLRQPVTTAMPNGSRQGASLPHIQLRGALQRAVSEMALQRNADPSRGIETTQAGDGPSGATLEIIPRTANTNEAHPDGAASTIEHGISVDEVVERAVQTLTRRLAIEGERRGLTQWR